MSNNAIIRRRTVDDLDRAAQALVAVHTHDGYPVEGVTDPTGWLTAPAPMAAWIAEHGGQLVGHVAISRPHGDAAVTDWIDRHPENEALVAVLGRLFVTPSARGMSLGERLTRTATAYADTYGLALVLDVMAKDHAAIRLYERLGWERMSETVHPYGDGQCVAAYTYQRRLAA